MAIGIIIGAFGKIVSSLVRDVLMPPLGLLTGKVHFSGLFLDLSRTSPASLAVAKAVNRFKQEAPPPPPGPTTEDKLLMEIRDLLKGRQ